MDRTAARNIAQLLAWGRLGIGATAMVAPGLVSRPWLGDVGGEPETRVFARAMGGRDLALGIGALRALAVSDDESRPWVALGGVADLVDAGATVLAFAQLPRRGRWGIMAITLGAALVSIRVAVSLDEPEATPAEAGGPRPEAG
jgi:hypothetical protein